MKVAACALIGLACVMTAFAAPSDNLIRTNIEGILGFLKSEGGVLSQILISSIDHDCIEEKYKSYKLEKYITDLLFKLDLSDAKEMTVEGTAVFGGITTMCSKRFDALLEFSYDALNSFGKLLHAFKDDHEVIKGYFEFMPCAINYAVEEKLFDAADYPTYDYSYGKFNKEMCEANISGLLENLDTDKSEIVDPEARKCLQTTATEFVTKIALKYVVLILNGMTDAQRVAERAHYISDFHTTIEKGLNCFVKTEELVANSIE